MSDNFETVVKNFSGLSTDTKPTTGAGNNVPNGSRFREVDTGRTYHYNSGTDFWYESGKYSETINEDTPVVDIRSLGVLEQILTTLKKIEYHLYLASDTELKDQDV